jgi:single-stranded DNA-binding protein
LLEVEVLEPPQIRYTQDNQTPLAEMTVQLDGLRPDDPPGRLRVVGWGNLAQDLQSRVQLGMRLLLEGRLRMQTVVRPDGLKEKRAEFSLSRLHPLGVGGAHATAPQAGASAVGSAGRSAPAGSGMAPSAPIPQAPPPPPVWNTSPLNPDDVAEGEDEIPF